MGDDFISHFQPSLLSIPLKFMKSPSPLSHQVQKIKRLVIKFTSLSALQAPFYKFKRASIAPSPGLPKLKSTILLSGTLRSPPLTQFHLFSRAHLMTLFYRPRQPWRSLLFMRHVKGVTSFNFVITYNFSFFPLICVVTIVTYYLFYTTRHDDHVNGPQSKAYYSTTIVVELSGLSLTMCMVELLNLLLWMLGRKRIVIRAQ